MLDRLFGRRQPQRATFRTPPDVRVYAIGDIHGRADLLAQLHAHILRDAAGATVGRKLIVYLGDYVDRGEGSRQVIDMLLDGPPPGFEAVYLSGNHEDMTLAFLDDASIAAMWMSNGGAATLFSYGVRFGDAITSEERFVAMQQDFRGALPSRHLDFLHSLRTWHVEGDYLFVHAGILPGRAIEDQRRDDLLWIREPFLDSTADHGCCVVHGHSIVAEPEVRQNRIAIDTGAYFSNRLTCAVLEGAEHRFLQS